MVDNIGPASMAWPRERMTLAPEEPADQRADRQQHDQAAGLHESEDEAAVAAQRRIVVVAAQEEALERRARLPLPGLGEREPQLEGVEGDPVEVARDLAVRRQHEDHGV